MRPCILLLCVVTVFADKQAASTLAEMVSLIQSRAFENNFFDGDMLNRMEQTEVPD